MKHYRSIYGGNLVLIVRGPNQMVTKQLDASFPVEGEGPTVAAMHQFACKLAWANAEPTDREDVLGFLALDVLKAVRKCLRAERPENEIRKVVLTVVLNRIRKVRARRAVREKHAHVFHPVATTQTELDVIDFIPVHLQTLAAFLVCMNRPVKVQDYALVAMESGIHIDDVPEAVEELRRILSGEQ